MPFIWTLIIIIIMIFKKIAFYLDFNYNLIMRLKNKAFSLLEILVSFFIISLLFLLGMKFYNEQREKNNIRLAQSELIEVVKYANMAKNTDGYYHQFLYQMGYTPDGVITTAIGTGAVNSAPCCNKYPALGTSPCAKQIGSKPSYNISNGQTCGMGYICTGSDCKFGQCEGSCTCEGSKGVEHYTYYNCKNDSLNIATNNIQICNDSSYRYNRSCIPASGLSFPSTFTKCAPSPATWCNCNSFMAGAKSNSFAEEITLNHNSQLCIKK